MRRLSPALLTMVMLGVVGLLVAMYFAKGLFAKEEAPDPDPIRNIPMALTDLPVGKKITAEDIGIGRARSSTVTPETVISERILIGRIVKEEIKAATPIPSVSLYPPNEGPPIELAAGSRAVTVALGGASSGTLNLVRPGEYVDILFTPSDLPNFDESGGLIMTLFKGVKIIAVNGVTQGGARRSDRGADSVTFEVSPEQANILLLASQRGALDITYTKEGKGSGVVAVEDEYRATLNQILGLTPPPDPETHRSFTTEVYPGSERHMRSFVNGKMTDRFQMEQRKFEIDNDADPVGDPRNGNRSAMAPTQGTTPSANQGNSEERGVGRSF